MYGGDFDGATAFSGGGFMPSQATQTADHPTSSSSSKSRDGHTLIPLTVNQISKALLSNDDKVNFLIDGVDVNNVKLVGMVLNRADRVTDISFVLDDGTGRIDCNRWTNDPVDTKEMEAIREGMYVRVHGQLKGFQGKKQMVVFGIKPVEDFDEITHHFVECIYVHSYNTKLMKAGGTNQTHMPTSTTYQTAPANQVLLSAGTDTSSGTMEWMLSHLLNNPEALKKAHGEIDCYVGDNRLINESDLPNLPYLRCIINETMRINPPGPLVFHESAKDCIVGGYHIPSGTMLLMNLWAMHNDPKNWEDPKKFKPERFVGLEGSRDGYKLMPFGAGRRRCPAENMAMRMVGLALGTLIQCFEWETTSDEMIDMTEGRGLTMPKAKPLVAKCRPRGKMANLISQL